MKMTPRNRIIDRQQYDDLIANSKALTEFMIDNGIPLVKDQTRVLIFHIRPILNRMFDVNPHAKEIKIRDIDEVEFYLLRHYFDVLFTMARHYHMPKGLLKKAQSVFKSTVIYNFK